MIETITQENFKEKVLEADGPVLVELWAPWCVYCRRLSPALDRLAVKLEGKIAVGKINVDEQPELERELDARPSPRCICISRARTERSWWLRHLRRRWRSGSQIRWPTRGFDP